MNIDKKEKKKKKKIFLNYYLCFPLQKSVVLITLNDFSAGVLWIFSKIISQGNCNLYQSVFSLIWRKHAK